MHCIVIPPREEDHDSVLYCIVLSSCTQGYIVLSFHPGRTMTLYCIALYCIVIPPREEDHDRSDEEEDGERLNFAVNSRETELRHIQNTILAAEEGIGAHSVFVLGYLVNGFLLLTHQHSEIFSTESLAPQKKFELDLYTLLFSIYSALQCKLKRPKLLIFTSTKLSNSP